MTTEHESTETLADRKIVEDGYARVNAMWKTQGAIATLRYVHHLPHGRALPLGLDLAELDRVIASCDSFYRGGHRDWPTQWFKTGDQYIERGRKALANGHRETAGQMLFTAAVCYHLAGYMHHDLGRLLPETKHSFMRAVEIYWEAAPYSVAAAASDRGSLRWHDAAAILARTARRRAAALRRPDRRCQFQHDQHARRVGVLPRSWHGDDRLRRARPR